LALTTTPQPISTPSPIGRGQQCSLRNAPRGTPTQQQEQQLPNTETTSHRAPTYATPAAFAAGTSLKATS
jgi:hypothetical protein